MDKSKLENVTSPKLYLDSQYEKIDENGLLSQRIFGPKVSYKCACGYYNSKIQHEGKTCPKCGVKCIDSFARYTTFAKISLSYPVFKPTYKNLRLLKSVTGKFKFLLDTRQIDLASSNRLYLSCDPKNDKLKIVDTYDPNNCIPLSITGIFSLYLALCAASLYFGSNLAKNIIDNCFTYELLVIPPENRPVYKKCEVGQVSLVASEINKYYQNLINFNNYQWTQIINPKEIRDNYLKMIQDTIYSDPIDDYNLSNNHDTNVATFQKYVKKIYDNIINTLSTKKGIIRKDFLGKSIDFCSRTHVIIDPSLKAYEIKLSRTNLIRLYFIEYIRFLIKEKNIKLDDVLLSVKLTESKITSKYPEYVDEFIEYLFTPNIDYHNRIVLINRQPTLWRYGIPGVTIVGVTEGDVTATSPLFLEAPNMDFDGDTGSVIRIHDREAQEEIEKLAHISNNIQYDHNPNYINKCKGEAMYAAYYLLHSKYDESREIIEINNLSELYTENFDTLFDITWPIKIGDNIYSYGQCLFNYWCGFKEIKFTKFIEPNEISKEIFKDSKSNLEYHDRLQKIMVTLFWYSSLNNKSPLTFGFSDIAELDFGEEQDKLQQLPQNPYIGEHVYKAVIQTIHSKIPDQHFFGKLLGSKLGKVKTQLSRICGAIGYIADDNNIVLDKPLTSNLINGLNQDDFFQAAMGARKGLVDKNRSTPIAGYLERSLVLNLSPIEIAENDCCTKWGLLITITSKEHAITLLNKYYSQYDPRTITEIGFAKAANNWRLFTEADIEKSIGKTFVFRSPTSCQSKDFKICKACFGETELKSPFVGIITGQSIAERMTQLSMRTFHTSGSSSLPTKDNIVKYIREHLSQIINSDERQVSVLIFDEKIPDDVQFDLSTISGYLDNNTLSKFYKDIYNYLTENYPNFAVYQYMYNVENQDVTFKIKEANQLLLKIKPSKDKCLNVSETYSQFMDIILDLGLTYSSFIENIFANMFVYQKVPIRYYLDIDPYTKPDVKLNLKQLHTIVSKLLGLLYEPNSISISTFSNDDIQDVKDDANTVYERLWKGIL